MLVTGSVLYEITQRHKKQYLNIFTVTNMCHQVHNSSIKTKLSVVFGEFARSVFRKKSENTIYHCTISRIGPLSSANNPGDGVIAEWADPGDSVICSKGLLLPGRHIIFMLQKAMHKVTSSILIKHLRKVSLHIRLQYVHCTCTIYFFIFSGD